MPSSNSALRARSNALSPAVADQNRDRQAGYRKIATLREALHVRDGDLIGRSYSDLLNL